MIEPKTPLLELIQDITDILDSDQIAWLETNKGYYIFKERTQLKELKEKQWASAATKNEIDNFKTISKKT